MSVKALIELLEKHGYTGGRDREAAKSWMAENADLIEFRSTDGKQMDFDDIWPKGITITIEQNDSEPDTVDVVRGDNSTDEGGDTGDTGGGGGEMPASGTASRHLPSARVARSVSGRSASGFHIRRREVAAYKSRIKRRDRGGFNHISERAVFDDVDRAEVAGSILRSELCKMARIYDYPQKARDDEVVTKAMSEGILSEGGTLVPDEFIPELIAVLTEYGAARRLVPFRPNSSGTAEYPRLGSDLTVSWASEGSAASDQTVNFGEVKLVAKKMLGLLYLSNEILNDAALNVVDMVYNRFANAIAKKEDDAFFNGDGSSTYSGIVGLAGAVGSAGQVTGSGSSWSAITNADVMNTLGVLQNAEDESAIKITCSRNAFYQVLARVMSDKGGVGYMESINGVITPKWHGMPVIFANSLPRTSASSTAFLYVGQFEVGAKAIQVTDSLRFDSSDHFRFANDQLTVRARERVDIVIHDAGDSTNAGPIAALLTA